MLGVVLAGGIGRRLSPITDGKPKYFIHVKKRPLIWYPIYALVNSGVDEIIIPVYKLFRDSLSEVIKKYFGDEAIFTLVDVNDYIAGNGYSLLTVTPYLGDDEFLLTMSDHIFDPEIPRILCEFSGDCVVGADATPIHIKISEATKIYSPNHIHVADIGKEIKYFNYIDMGVFKFRSEPIKTLYETDYSKEYTVSKIVKWMIGNGYEVRIANLSGYHWIDVDTIDEYWSVEKGFLSILPEYIVMSMSSEAQ